MSDDSGEEEWSGDERDGSDEEEDALEMDAVFGLRDAQEILEEKKDFINHKALMLEKVKEIELGQSQGFDEVPWDTLQVVVTKVPLQEILGGDIEDDFKRESAIVQQGMEGAEEAYRKLREMKIPYVRPNDYFAEMAKTDIHMTKVRKRLVAEKTRVEGIEERRRLRQMKKYGKEIQKEKIKERDEVKRGTLDAVKKWRKEGKPEGLDDDSYLNKIDNKGKQQRGVPKAAGSMPNAGSLKRSRSKTEMKNEKYGYGGPKKRAKRNTAESAASFDGFSIGKNKHVPKDLKRKLPQKKQSAGAKKGGSTNRPGKNRRRQS